MSISAAEDQKQYQRTDTHGQYGVTAARAKSRSGRSKSPLAQYLLDIGKWGDHILHNNALHDSNFRVSLHVGLSEGRRVAGQWPYHTSQYTPIRYMHAIESASFIILVAIFST